MKYLLVVFIALFSSAKLLAEEEYRLGVGLSAEYNGAGVSLSKVNEDQLFYASLGYGGFAPFSDHRYGAGVGWLTSSPFSNNHHSVGIHLGAMYHDAEIGDAESDISGKLLGLYVYNFNGIDQPGFHLTVFAGTGSADHGGRFQAGFGGGYRF